MSQLLVDFGSIFEKKYFQDEYMVLACDGVYDVFSNDELAMLLRAQIAEKHAECSTAENITHAIEDILNISLNRGSIDNMTIIVIVFENIFHERGIGL